MCGHRGLSMKCFTLQTCSCWYTLFANVDVGRMIMKSKMIIKYTSAYEQSDNGLTKNTWDFSMPLTSLGGGEILNKYTL